MRTNPLKILTFRTLLVGAGAAALAACQATSPYAPGARIGAQPSYPTRLEASAYPPPAPYTPAPPYPAAPVAVAPPVEPAYTPAPTGGIPMAPVRSQPLAPLAAAPIYPAPPPPPVTSAPPPVIAAPPVTVAAATGAVVEAEGLPAVHIVAAGDTLSSIAREMGVSASALASQNSLTDPSAIRPGQRIEGPATRVKAYVVQPGDTLSAIGRRFNVSSVQLAETNKMTSADVIRPNQRLLLPAGYRDTGASSVQVAAAPSPPRAAAPAPAPAAAAPRPVASAPTSTSASGKFIWPLDGRVVGEFGPRGPNQQADGIDIAAPQGTAVRASAAGTVIYAGVLDGFGNLVLVDHGNEYRTAYAHLAAIDVTERQQLAQGQSIGTVGATGDATASQLYFDVRQRTTSGGGYRPLNPISVLPRR